MFEGVQYHVLDLLRKFNSSQSYFFVSQSYFFGRNFNCEQFESGTNLQFDTWSEVSKRNKESFSLFNHNSDPDRREIRFIKIAFACQIQQVILNSFEHFPWRKIGPRHTKWLNFFWHMCYPSLIVRILNHEIRILF